MIEVHFFDYGCGVLDVEKELGIDVDFDFFLNTNIPRLSLESTDSKNDMEDNAVYLFSANKEDDLCSMIRTLIDSHMKNSSNMKYTVKIIE